jgi:hypothetical protein
MADRTKPRNPHTSTSIVFLILTIIFIFIIFLPSILEMDMMRWGFGIAFISFFLAVLFAITSGIYGSMARKLSRLFSEANTIAHWHYNKEEWLKYSQTEFRKQKNIKRNLFILITVVVIVVGGIFTFMHRDVWKPLAIGFLGLLLLLGFFAVIIPRIRYYRNKNNSHPNVFIGLNGIFLSGEFRLWNFLTSKLEEVTVDDSKMLINIKYSYSTNTGIESIDVRIPIPQSKLKEAVSIAEKLISSIPVS